MAGPSLLQDFVATEQAGTAQPPAPTREMTNVYDEQGNALPIEEVGMALSDGRARFDMDQQYNLLTPNSEARIVRGGDVYEALRQGWRLESNEERELRRLRERAGFAEHATSAAAGIAETLSLGTAPAIAEILGGQSAGSAWKRAREVSPEAHFLGEALGFVTPMGVEALATRGLTRGAAGMAARGVTAAPRAVSSVARGTGEAVAGLLPEATTTLGQALKKGAQLGVEGAVEGSVYGAGYTVGEAALGDKELTAERLLAGAGSGALLGAGIGGGLGIAGTGARALAERGIGGLEGFAERQAWKATGATGAQTRQVGIDQAKRSGRRMLDEGLVKFESFEERAAALRKATGEAGEQIGKLIERIDDTGQRPSIAPILERVDEQLGKLREGVGADVRLAKKLDRDFGDWLRDRAVPGKEPTFKELHGMRARVDDYLEAAKNARDSVRQAELSKLRTTVEDEIKRQADGLAPRVGDDFLGEYTAAKSRYQDLIAATKVAEYRAPMLEAGNRSISLTDTIAAAGGLAAGGPGGLLLGLGNKAIREYGDVAAALLANKLGSKTAKAPSLAEVMSGATAANDTTATLYQRLVAGQIPEAEWKFRREGMREASSAQVSKAYSGAASPNDIATGVVVPPGSKEPLPPIQLNIDSAGEVFLRDGRHRFQEAQKAGATKIRATIQTIDDYHEKGPFDLEPVVINLPGRGGPDAAEIRSKLEALGYVKAQADKVAIAMSKDVRDAVSGDTHSIVARGASKGGAYATLAQDAREHQIAPERSATKIAARVAPLVESAPELARAVTAKATGDLDYLASQLPTAGVSGLAASQANAIQPSGSELASFTRKARAIQEPRTVLFDMKNGRLSDDAIQAVKERRPLLLSKIQEEAEMAYADLVRQGKAPSRQQRLQLEKLLGHAVDPASSPVVIRVVQRMYAEDASTMTTTPPPTGNTTLDRVDRMMSQSEAIARGDGQ